MAFFKNRILDSDFLMEFNSIHAKNVIKSIRYLPLLVKLDYSSLKVEIEEFFLPKMIMLDFITPNHNYILGRYCDGILDLRFWVTL